MLDLNLLSPENKINISRLNNFSIIVKIGVSLTLLCAVIGGLFFLSYWLLNENLNQINASIENERLNTIKQSNVSIDEIIKSLNVQLGQADAIQKNYIQWSTFLFTLANSVPDNISLTLVDVNSSTKTFRITGLADSRENLLLFQDNLNTLPFISDLISPLSNLAQQKTFNFEISGKLTDALYETN
ncbi:MAG: PilN domain-containing protein [Patescibacteria group bacterium]